jgi:hypothetical protein
MTAADHVQGTRRTYPIGNTNRVAVIDGWLTKCWEIDPRHPDIDCLLEARHQEESK